MAIGRIEALNYVVLPCVVLEQTRAFYEAVFQFPVVEDRPTWVSFQAGGTLLTLRPRGVWPVCDDGPIPPETAAVQLAFQVPLADVDAWHSELVARNIPIIREPTDIPFARHRTLFFRDPENNILEIYGVY